MEQGTVLANARQKSVSSKGRKGLCKNQLILGDCLELIGRLDSGSVYLIATDPPYEINFENNAWDSENSLNWEALSKEFYRVLKPTGNLVLFQGWSNVMKTHAKLDAHFELKNWIIYDRIKGRGAKTNLVSTREDILWYVKDVKDYTYNKISSTILKKTGGTIGKKNGNQYRALSNVWTDISPIVPWSKERVKHPTQKPVMLMDRIIKIFSNENDIVLDPFAGSGTTAISSMKNNRDYICFENKKEYFDIMKDRIRKYQHIKPLKALVKIEGCLL